MLEQMEAWDSHNCRLTFRNTCLLSAAVRRVSTTVPRTDTKQLRYKVILYLWTLKCLSHAKQWYEYACLNTDPRFSIWAYMVMVYSVSDC